jgi:hypothetical protein
MLIGSGSKIIRMELWGDQLRVMNDICRTPTELVQHSAYRDDITTVYRSPIPVERKGGILFVKNVSTL